MVATRSAKLALWLCLLTCTAGCTFLFDTDPGRLGIDPAPRSDSTDGAGGAVPGDDGIATTPGGDETAATQEDDVNDDETAATQEDDVNDDETAATPEDDVNDDECACWYPPLGHRHRGRHHHRHRHDCHDCDQE